MQVASPLPRCPICGFAQEGNRPSTPDAPLRCARSSCGVEFLSIEGESIQLRTFRLVEHYSLCVLPFAFTEHERGEVRKRLDRSGRWRPRTFSLDDPDDIDRTEYFLPYIRRFLFPSLYTEPEKANRREPTCLHYDFDLSRLGTINGKGLPLSLRCHDTRKNQNFKHELLLENAQLLVFSYRVGFLILRFRCAEEQATFFDQMNSLIYLRTIAPLYRGFEMPELTSGAGTFRIPQLLPFLLAEFGAGSPPASPSDLPAKAPLPVKPIYDDRMMVYTFSCLDKETCLTDVDRCQSLLHQATVVNFDDVTPPMARGKQAEDELVLWMKTRWQGYSKDGGSQVVFNTDRFHERFLGVYHGTYYFDIFLLATLQRVTLLNLYERLSDIPSLTTGTLRGSKLLRRVRLDLLLFKNQVWFSQITNRERGLQLWKKWQEVFETRTLLAEVNEQSGELDNYLRSRMRERVEWLLRLGGFLAAAIPGIYGLETLLGPSDLIRTLRWLLLVLVIVGTGVFAWFFLFRRGDEP